MHAPQSALYTAHSLPGHDGTLLYLHHWAPPRPTRATVVVVHGYAEHAGRYGHVAERLAAEGMDVWAYDQRGYGRSNGPRAYVRSFDEYLADLDRVVVHVGEAGGRAAERPLFVLGHSMGGGVAGLWAASHPDRLDGLILSSPLARIPTSPLLQRVSGVLGRLAPHLPTVPLEREAISRDPAVVAAAEADPLCFSGRVRARTGAEMVRAAHRLRERADRLSMPLLVFHGTADRIMDPAGSRELHAAAASPDKTLRLHEGLYHETMNEPEGDAIIDEVVAWIDERIAAPANGTAGADALSESET